MTPKEKAQDLLSKYTSITLKEVVPGIFLAFDEELCKKFALIAVNEILDGYEFDSLDIEHKRIMDNINFWDEVKQEIEKL